MPDRISELEGKVAELSESLREVERRLGLLEQGQTPAAARRARAAAAAAQGVDPSAEMLRQDVASAAGTVSLAGRTLLVLAGAYFLRALTDAGRLPTWLGVAMGFVYAGIWVAAADRAAGRRLLASAGFHGAAAAAIGFPLLFEATARFRLLPTWLATVLLTAFTAVALAVAARRKFEVLGWIVVLAAVGAGYALMFAQGRIAAPLLFLLLLGGATVWLGYLLGWGGLRWPSAAATDVAVLFLAFEAVRSGAANGPATAFLMQFATLSLYLGSTAVRTLGFRRSVGAFDMVQGAAVLLVGLGGAAFVSASVGTGAAVVGGLSIAFGAAAYGIAFSLVGEKRTPANCHYYAITGLAFVLAGAIFLFPPSVQGLSWAVLAIGAALSAQRAGRLTLAWHAAAYALAAGLASGLLPHGIEAAFNSPEFPWSSASPVQLAVAAALAAASWTLGSALVVRPSDRVPRVALLGALALAIAGLLIGWIAPAVAGRPGAGADPGMIAMVRTVVLALGALALAAMSRLRSWRDARVLAWPVLVLAGLKMIVDLPSSRPATLFLAFALYGAALILVPRLRRRHVPSERAEA